MITTKQLKENFIPLRLEFLSPVHIGSGETLSPLEYRVEAEADGKHYVYTIDYTSWLESLSAEEAKQVANKFALLNQTKIWQFLRKEIDKDIFSRTKSRTTQAVYEKYLKRLHGSTSENELAPATRNPLTASMIIPASSLKGAIRTAIIDYCDNGALKINYNAALEQFFGKITNNAFQALKISDFELLPDESVFVEAIEYNPKKSTKNAMKPICEIAPHTTLPKYGRMYMGRFADNTNKNPLTPWTFENLCSVCNDFYLPHFENEYNKFYTLPLFSTAKSAIEQIRSKIMQHNALLLRVGHYSHIECMTVKNNAPKTRKNNKTNQPFPYGTTRTLADGKYPFGWVLLHKCDQEEYQQAMQAHEQEKKKLLQAREERKQSYIHSKKQANEAQKQQQEKALREAEAERLKKQAQKEAQEAEEARLEQEKQARKQALQAEQEAETARLAALSPEKRLVELVLLKKATKEEVQKAFDLLQSQEDSLPLAAAIKAFWQKEKLWSGKKLKPNQQERVKIITALLKNV